MSRVLFIQDDILDEVDFAPLGGQNSELDFVGVDTFAEMRAALARERFDALLVPYSPATDGEYALDALLDDHPDVSIICALSDGDNRAAAQVASHHSAGFLFIDQLRSAHAASLLEALIDRLSNQADESRLQRELEQRNSELLGLNALASAVSSSLSRDVIVRRALWVFGGLCRRGAAALMRIDPPPPLPDESGSSEEPLDEELSIRCAGAFAVDGKPVCADADAIGQWIEVIQDDEIRSLDASIAREDFPGLEPLLDRLDDGILMMVPIWGHGRALGLLVLADLAGGNRMPFTREGLRAMGAQLGGALENARLFEEVTGAYGSLKRTQDQLVHAEKFAAMGVLAAEIAHEINNPASFVISNLSVMVDYVETIGEFSEHLYGRIKAEAPELAEEWKRLAEEHEISYLREDLGTLLTRSLGGMQRIHQIVQDLRFFSHDGTNEPGWINVEDLLESTLNLVKHEAKYRAELELDFGGVPQIFSDANRLSQVFLNLLVNAAHAIKTGSVEDNTIRVSTRRRGEDIEILVSDTGEGITEETLPHIFDPFFTTKEKGEGTGLGLSIARDIVRSLGGDISVSSTRGDGTTFKVVLPIRAPRFEADPEIRDTGSFTSPRAGRDTEDIRNDVDKADNARRHIGKDR